MEYRELIKDKIVKTSLLGFGCMRFPMAEGKIDPAKTIEMLEEAYSKGITYYDTAWPYLDSQSEKFLGENFVKHHKRESFELATKLPCWEVKNLEDAKRIFHQQLENLQTDYVDYYLLHALSKDRFENMVALGIPELLFEYKKQGLIRHVGFSFHDSYEVFEQIINAPYQWDFAQIQLNYMDCEEQAGMKGYELAASKGIPLVIMEPVKGGSLAALPDDIHNVLAHCKCGRSDASWALRFIADLPGVMTILSGMTTFEQLKDNLETFNTIQPLSTDEKNAITQITAMLKARTKNGCTGCRYCMPCPAGVNIPENFRIWNQYYRFMNKGEAIWNWRNNLPKDQHAAVCIECGKCEQVCPQHLDIRQDLKRVSTDLNAL